MAQDWAGLRQRIQIGFPTSRLAPMSDSELAELQRKHPQVPAHYLQFLKNVGWGNVGDMGFMFYQGPMEPSEIYDAETAKDLKGILFIGDNFGGWVLGVNERGNLVSFDGSSAGPEPEEEGTVYEFLADWVWRVRSA